MTADVSDSAGNAAAQATKTITHDAASPSGYTVSIDQDPINDSNKAAVSFTFAGAEVGATFNYTFSDGSAGANVTGTGTITSATQTIASINLSAQADGTTTLPVTLTDPSGNTGAAATDTSTRDTAAPTGYTAAINENPINAANKAAV
ncbi:hypothetical protein JYT20_01770, partial [Rhodothermus sp. AH-315-K08]|nr:hypothetical protein [Rhodothermus sp. AH-315-K08]